jgi:hypothetical protein
MSVFPSEVKCLSSDPLDSAQNNLATFAGRSRRADGCGVEKDALTFLAGHNGALLVRPSFSSATEG